MKSKWCIIADDFTGAGDAAVQFASAGRPVHLVRASGEANPNIRGSDMIVVDTDSRLLSPSQAYERVERTTRKLCKAGPRTFFKKIDSTLRGNLADEIAAVMDAANYRFALVAPSAPRNGRTVESGHCMVNGMSLMDTGVSMDSLNPVKESRIASLLEKRFPGCVRELDLEVVRSGSAALESKVNVELSRGARVFVVDAETMADLKIAASLADMDGVLLVGSSGLAEALAFEESTRTLKTPRFPLGRSLFVIGSVTTISALQCARLAGTGKVTELVVDADAAIASPSIELRRLIDLVDGAPKKRALLIRTSGSNKPLLTSLAGKQTAAEISNFLGRLTLLAVRARRIRLLFVSGGDTAARIVEAMETDLIVFIAELFPGLPFGSFWSGAMNRKLYFVTKSGGFGGPNAMAEALEIVTSQTDFSMGENA